MNLPNKLTVSRLVLTVFFLFAIFGSFPFNNTVALVIFSVASITDYFDGSIAHEFEEDAGRTGSRIYYGVNYWLEPSAVLKLGAESTSLDGEGAGHGAIIEDRVFLQLAFGF